MATDRDRELVTAVQTAGTQATIAKALICILQVYPEETLEQLAGRVGWMKEKVAKYLRFHKLEPTVLAAVTAGEIVVASAYMLTRLPVEEQPAWIERAKTKKPWELTPEVNIRAAELKPKREPR
jgi:hypothetical protein